MMRTATKMRLLPMAIAFVAILFSLVQAPLMASAMHANMSGQFSMHEDTMGAPMTMAFMSVDATEDTACSGDDCSIPLACLQHCLEQATAHDSAAVVAQPILVRVPAVTSLRTTYPDEEPSEIPSEYLSTHTNALVILRSTHKRE